MGHSKVKNAWLGPSSQAVTRDRLQGAVNASKPAKGDHMSFLVL